MPRFQKERVEEVKHSLADITKAKRLLSHNPSINFQNGLHRTVKWLSSDLISER